MPEVVRRSVRSQLQCSSARDHRGRLLLHRENLRPTGRDRRRVRGIKPTARKIGIAVLLHAPNTTDHHRHSRGSWITFHPETLCPQERQRVIPRSGVNSDASLFVYMFDSRYGLTVKRN
ncbi:hypothetical protein ACFPRL_27730 [Pseudoclavibacter helvolus]